MELVYLWVEEYKNIKQQGFSFSPRFECSYDEEKNELKIDKRKNYVDIFPKNINVTAIVGENGSGKSSLLVCITNHKAIFKIGNEYFSRSFDLEKINSSLEIRNNNKNISKYVVYVDFDLIKFQPINDYWDYGYGNIYNRNLYKSIENSIAGDIDFSIPKYIHNFYNLIMEHKASFESKLFFFNPNEIIFNDYLHEVNSTDSKWLNINKLIKEVSQHPFSKKRFLLFLFEQISAKVSLQLPSIENTEDLLTHEQTILENAEYLKIENAQNIYSFFADLNAVPNKTQMLIENFIPFYEKHKEVFLKLIDIAYLQINFRDTLQREYSDLSQGERKLFTEMLMIFDAIKKNDNNHILVVLDEPDLMLHPGWQKKYLYEMIRLLANFPEKKFHLIITSHSPFILSDLPKENVIFLKEGKQVDVDIDTFGANIHTLLSHGFFMENGLMGEFAKGKIDNVIKYLNGEESDIKDDREAQNTISIIGEPILKQQLQKMLSAKLETSNKQEIDKIKEQIKHLEDELAKRQGVGDDSK